MTPTALAALLAALVPGAARAPAPAAPLPASVKLADGLEILAVPMPASPRAALRLVVRAGGADDPVYKAGLAHLVEHLVMKGSDDEDGRALDEDARRAGATLNAHTSAALTTFELEAPADAFAPLASRLLRTVTSPAWDRFDVEAELGVVETEARYHPTESLLSLVDQALFPAPAQPGPLAGTTDSRGSLGREDAIRFFQTRYLPSRTTVVFAGPVRLEEARAIVERSYRIPPALPSEAPRSGDDAPVLGQQQKIAGGVNITFVGYALHPDDVGACEAIAALVELRLALALQVDGPMLPGVAASCPVLRGYPFLLAAAYGTTLDVGDLPKTLDEAIVGVASAPPTPAERAAIDARLDARERRMLAEPALLAQAAGALAVAGDPRPLAARIRGPRLPAAPELARFAARSLGRERRIVVNVSPTYQ